jgi:predicted Zn finger-like uncharacterized protein
MKIVCPSCDAIYEVPDKVVTSRRKMRCARCATDWVPADTMPASAPPAAAPAQEAIPPGPSPADPRPAASAFGRAAPMAEPAPPPDDEPAPAPPRTGYVLVDPVPEPDEPELETGPDSRRDDEPYQLALRPETHVNVFPDRDAPSVFGTASTLRVRPVPKGPPILAWVLSVVVLLAFIGGVVVFRGAVMKVWPPSERLYAALGLVQQQQ